MARFWWKNVRFEMDPNKTLEELRMMLKDYLEASDKSDDGVDLNEEAARRVVESFEDLDDWLRKGGFLPEDWAR
jgi:hypothetical protein